MAIFFVVTDNMPMYSTDEEAREEARKRAGESGEVIYFVTQALAKYTRPEPQVVETNLIRRHKAKNPPLSPVVPMEKKKRAKKVTGQNTPESELEKNREKIRKGE